MSSLTTVRYRGDTYIRVATKQYFTFDEIASKYAMEYGDIHDPEGNWYPGWVDKDGWKYAETEDGYLRTDTLPGWTWEWGEDLDDSAIPADGYPTGR